MRIVAKADPAALDDGGEGEESGLKSALGPDLHRTFVAIKQAEYLRVARTVSELDYHLYLHEV